MLQDAHSSNKFGKVRVWNDSDNRVNFEAHVEGLVEQLLELQEHGLTVSELLAPLPPCLITIGLEETAKVADACKTTIGAGESQSVIGMEWSGGASSWETWEVLGACAREVLVTAVTMYPDLCLCLDGGAFAAAAGVRCCAERPSLFSSWTKSEFAQPYKWHLLKEGETIRSYCESVRPGDAGFLALALWVQRWRVHGKGRVATLTRTPPRINRAAIDDDDDDDSDDEDTGGGLFGETDRQRQATRARNQELNERAMQGAQGEAVTTWSQKELRDMSPQHGQLKWIEMYESPVDGEKLGEQLELRAHTGIGLYGIDVPVTVPTLVRVPVTPEPMGSRPLPDAAWAKLAKGEQVMLYACLCILHGAMRTGENMYERQLSVRRKDRTRVRTRTIACAPPIPR